MTKKQAIMIAALMVLLLAVIVGGTALVLHREGMIASAFWRGVVAGADGLTLK